MHGCMPSRNIWRKFSKIDCFLKTWCFLKTCWTEILSPVFSTVFFWNPQLMYLLQKTLIYTKGEEFGPSSIFWTLVNEASPASEIGATPARNQKIPYILTLNLYLEDHFSKGLCCQKTCLQCCNAFDSAIKLYGGTYLCADGPRKARRSFRRPPLNTRNATVANRSSQTSSLSTILVTRRAGVYWCIGNEADEGNRSVLQYER